MVAITVSSVQMAAVFYSGLVADQLVLDDFFHTQRGLTETLNLILHAEGPSVLIFGAALAIVYFHHLLQGYAFWGFQLKLESVIVYWRRNYPAGPLITQLC